MFVHGCLDNDNDDDSNGDNDTLCFCGIMKYVCLHSYSLCGCRRGSRHADKGTRTLTVAGCGGQGSWQKGNTRVGKDMELGMEMGLGTGSHGPSSCTILVETCCLLLIITLLDVHTASISLPTRMAPMRLLYQWLSRSVAMAMLRRTWLA